MPDEKPIFDNAYVAPDKETKPDSLEVSGKKNEDDVLKVESEKYTKGKPYRVVLRGRLVRDEQENAGD